MIRLRNQFSYTLIVQWTLIISASAGSAGTQQKIRELSSKVSMEVLFVLPNGWHSSYLGSTHNNNTVLIPEVKYWYVRPSSSRLTEEIRSNYEDMWKDNYMYMELLLGKILDNKDLQPVLSEIRAQSIPGLSIKWGERVSDAGLADLAGLKSLKYLDLSGCKLITDATLQKMKGLNGLKYLNLYGCELLTDEGYAHLKGLTKLETLYFGGKKVTDASLEICKGMKASATLTLGGCKNITGAGFVHLKGLPRLTELALGQGQTNTEHFAHLAGISSLTSVRFPNNVNNDEILAGFPQLKSLRSLYLTGAWDLTDASVANIKRLPALEELYIGGDTSITDAGVAEITSMTTLKILDLFDSQTSERGLLKIGRLKNLETLSVGRKTKPTQALMAELASIPNLTELYWHGAAISDENLELFARLTHLTTLVLNGQSFTDKGLAKLKVLTNLERLDLHTCENITDAGMLHLYSLKKLRILGLRGTKITPAAVAGLKKNLPKCKVEKN